MHDFIAIGDTATDVFIKLEDDRIKVEGTPDTPDYRISLPFAAKVPYKEATTLAGVGNAPNAAVAAAKLGLHSALVAHVGADDAGKETVETLKNQGIDTQFIVAEEGKHTNYSYILWHKDDRTILRRNEEFKYVLPPLGTPKWVYISSIGSESTNTYEELADFLENNPTVKLAFQPGSKEIPLGQKLARIYKRADIYFSNVEEAEMILGINTLGIQELIKRFHELGPKIVVITDGPKGAYAYDGVNMYQQMPYPDPKPPYERTGAGDAFSSTTVVALALGNDLPTALSWGAVNSMSVVQEIGAQKGLLNREKIEEYLNKAPADFKAKKIN
ncbi:carbohydrate kinase family protein [Candidatus Parcubacteria bacterium]|nr:carbohydrate kinase family protein [Candidatus Parcubacteria bacterium]